MVDAGRVPGVGPPDPVALPVPMGGPSGTFGTGPLPGALREPGRGPLKPSSGRVPGVVVMSDGRSATEGPPLPTETTAGERAFGPVASGLPCGRSPSFAKSKTHAASTNS